MEVNETLLYTYINALLSLHQKIFLLHQAGTNTNTTARHAERERPWSICPTGVVPIKSLPFGLRETHKKEDRKRVRARGDGTPSQQRPPNQYD